MPVAWNVRYVTDQAMWLVVSLMVITYKKNRVNYTSAWALFIWCVIDTILYFYNYKTSGYFVTYFWLPAAWFVIYYWKSKQAERLWQRLNILK